MAANPRLDDFEALAQKTSASRPAVKEAQHQLHEVDAEGRSQERTDTSRSLLTTLLSWLYVVSVLSVLVVLALHVPTISGVGGDRVLDPYAAAMVDVLKAVVLPVITFMLGFYFGVGKLNQTARDLAPKARTRAR